MIQNRVLRAGVPERGTPNPRPERSAGTSRTVHRVAPAPASARGGLCVRVWGLRGQDSRFGSVDLLDWR